MNKNKFPLALKTFAKKDNIIRTIYIAGILLFCLLPLLLLLFNITSSDISFVIHDEVFKSAVKNSLFYSFVSAIISTLLALISAYLLSRSSIKKKGIILLLTLPMLIPTLSVGLGLRITFGIKGFLDILFSIQYDAIGFFGLIVGSVIVSFPPTFLIIYDALRYENKAPYDAAEIMGIKKTSTFFKVTLPYLIKPLITAFFACFTLVFSDYGMPMELSGKVPTLPLYLYQQISTVFKYGRGALVGVVLLLPAVLSFVVDLFLKEDHSDTSSQFAIKPTKLFNAITIFVMVIVIIFITLPEVAFISLSLLKGFPNNISFTFENIIGIFTNTRGIGLLAYIKNSLVMSLLTGIIGVSFAYTLAYFSTRVEGKLGRILHFLAISSIAIPGIVLGVGYIFLFKGTKGWFYGTVAILVAVNVIHFLGSPYIMAKNCFSKMNRDYEIVGKTIGVSKTKIFFNVLLPNSLGTIIEMFMFYFLNSMITISAVAFLCNYANQPLSILINTYEKSGNYEMQAMVSLCILVINLLFKGLFSIGEKIVSKKIGVNDKHFTMVLNRFQFDLLTFLEKKGSGHYTQRELADTLTISLGSVNKLIKELSDVNYISQNAKGDLFITDKGLNALEPYRVKKAIILAAGFGSRLAPVTLDIPKPLIKVNGERIIDTLIDALLSKGIENITIVRGYKKEKFDELKEKYPLLQFADNEKFNTSNNIASMISVVDRIDRCYICEADLVISNKDIISKYEYATCYMGAKVSETEDWCFKKKNTYLTNYQLGGEDCYQAFGISYWDEKDSAKLRKDLVKVYNSRGGKENYWEAVPLRICKKNYDIEIKKCHKTDIIEIDNFYELIAVDESYKNYPGHENF